MNKVHKVIWNRVKHCYVVVSEIAKNQGKDGKRNGSLLRGAVLAALLAGAFTMPAFGPAGDTWAAAPVASTTSQTQYLVFMRNNNENDKEGYHKVTLTAPEGQKFPNDQQNGEFWVRNGYDAKVEINPRLGTKKNFVITVTRNKDYREETSDKGILVTYIPTVNDTNDKTIYGYSHKDSGESGIYGGASNSTTVGTKLNEDYVVNGKTVKANGNGVTENVTYNEKTGKYQTNDGEEVDISNVYVLANGSSANTYVFKSNGEIYTGAVYGTNNEILRTGIGEDGKIYSYWGAEVDPSQVSLSKLTLKDYQDDKKRLETGIRENYKQLPSDFRATENDGKNGGNLALYTMGGKALNDIAVTAAGGTGGTDTSVKVSVGAHDVYNPETGETKELPAVEFTLPTGSKVEGDSKTALTKLTINGETYTIQDNNDNDYVKSGVVSTKDGKTVLSLTRESGAVVPDIDLSAIKGTTYSAGDGITISQDNKISAKVIENGNLTVDANGLALKKDIDLTNSGSLKVGGVTIDSTGINAGSKKITNVSAGSNPGDAVNVSQLNNATWTPKASGTTVTPLANGGKNYVNFKGSDHLTVTNTGAGEITFKDKDLAYTNLSNVTNITGTGKNAITNIAKDAIKVVAGTNVTVDTKAGDANTPKTFTITAKDTTLSPNGVKKDTIMNGYKYTVSDTANHTAVIDDVASAKKLGEINTTLNGKLIKSGTIGNNGKITLQPNSGAAIELGGRIHDYAVTQGSIDTSGNLNLLTTDSYGGGASKKVVISGIASRKYVEDTEDYVTSGQVNTNGTITLKRKLGQSMTISGLENYVTSKDTYVTEATYNNATKKLTIKQNQGKKTFEISLADITSGLSKTDYRLVQNPSAADGKYTVNSSGEVALKIKDEASGKIETVTVGGIAVVYDNQGSLKSTNATVRLETKEKASTSISLGKNAWVSVDEGKKANGISFGNDTYTGGIAIGENTKAKNNSVTIGTNTYNGKIGDIDLSKYEKTTSQGVGTTTVGSNSYTWGTLATNIGTYNVTTTGYGQSFLGSLYVAQNFGSTILGTMNSIESATSSSPVAGIANSIVGVANRTQNSNGSLIFGAGNEITNSIGTINGSPDGDSVTDAAESFRQSVKDNTGGGAVLAIGGGNKADYVKHSQLMGVNNTVTGTSRKNAEYVLVDGYNNTVTNSQNVTAIGSNNTVTGDSNKIYGDNHKVNGVNNVIIGSAKVKDTETTASDAVILGYNANATVNGGVAIGEGAIASTDKGVVGYGYTGKDGEEGAIWKSTAAAVSVGSNGVTRQITNVAAGSADTDAVNVAQLEKVADVANAGWNISIDKPDGSSQTRNVAAGSTLKVTSSDSNLLADLGKADDGTVVMKVDLNKDITLKADDEKSQFISISGSEGTIWTSGDVTVGAGEKNIALHAGTQTITGLSNTTLGGTDFAKVGRAATEEQLQAVSDVANTGWNLTASGVNSTNVAPGDTVDFASQDTNLSVTKGEEENNVTIALNQDLHLNSVKTGDTKMTTDGVTVGDSVTLTKEGLTAGMTTVHDGAITIGNKAMKQIILDEAKGISVGGTTYVTNIGLSGGGQKIANVADGEISDTSTDAVNGSQLKKYTDAAKTTVSEGKNITVTPTTEDDGHTDYNVKLNDDIKLGGDDTYVSINGTKGTIWTSGDVTIGNNIGNKNIVLSAENQTITGLANTSTKYDGFATTGKAATEEQLKEATAAATTTVVGGLNTNVTSTTADDGHVEYKVNLNEDINLGDGQIVLKGSNGTMKAAHGLFSVAENGDVALKTTNKEGEVGKETLHLGAEEGTISAAQGAFSVDKFGGLNASGGDFTVNKDGNIYSNFSNGQDKDGKTRDYKMEANQDGFYVQTDNRGVSGSRFTVSDTGTISEFVSGTTRNESIIDGQGVTLQASTDGGNTSASKVNVNADKVTFAHGDSTVTVDAAGTQFGNSETTTLINGKQITAGTVVINGEEGKSTIKGLTNTTLDGDDFARAGRAATEEQLKLVNDTATMGWNLSTNGGDAVNVAPGAKVDFSNTDKNVVITQEGTNIKVDLAKDITVDSIKATTGDIGGVKMLNGAIVGDKYTLAPDGSIWAADGAFKVRQDGHITAPSADIGGVNISLKDENGLSTISGVAAGKISADSTDAVNGSQLHAVETLASKHSTVTVNNKNTENENLILEATENDNGGTNYDVKLADKVTLGTDTEKSVTVDGTAGLITVGGTLNLGLQNSGYYLTGLTNTTFNISNGGYKDYAGSGRAATEGQLYDAFSFLDNKIDNISITGDGNVVVNPDGKGNGGTGEGGTTTPGTGTETSDPKPSPNWNIGLNNEKITLGDATNSVVIEGTKGNVTTTGTIKAGNTSISSDGLKVGDKTYVSKDGLNANDQKVTNVAAGDVSATSKDAVNGSQLYGVEQKVDNNSQNINILNGSLRNLDNRVNRVGAGAAALAALHPLDFDPDAKWDFSAGYGNYNGANAVSVGAFYRPNEDLMFSVGGSMGGGENMVNAGLSVKLGSGSSHVTTSKVAMAKEIKDLRQTVDAQAQQIAELAAMVRELTGKGTQTPTAGMFPDVPENHWAYEAVKDLKDRGYVAGYPDGTFKGDRTMTRYEFAQIVHNALQAGAPDSEAVKKLKAEFAPELEQFTVDTIEQDKNGNPTIQRVRVVKKANG